MKLDSAHLSYCTNIHAGESWKDHFESLDLNFPIIKKEFSPNQAMGIGLRLSVTCQGKGFWQGCLS